METIFDAKDLRRSGYYKWYAPEDLYKEILTKLKIDFDEAKNKTEILVIDNETFYGIYIGIAEDQPVIRRIGNHLYNSFNSSTLRKSIAAVLETTNHDEVNEFMDKLKVQFFFEVSENLHEKERELLQNHFFVLNIQGNSTWTDKITLLKERRKNLFS